MQHIGLHVDNIQILKYKLGHQMERMFFPVIKIDHQTERLMYPVIDLVVSYQYTIGEFKYDLYIKQHTQYQTVFNYRVQVNQQKRYAAIEVVHPIELKFIV